MRILTHNHLICVVKSCPRNFPLRINPIKLEQGESDFSVEFITHILSSIDYDVLKDVAKQLMIDIPSSPEGIVQDETQLQALHTLMLDTHIEEGQLCCDGCGRTYNISSGIPNMLLREDEV